MAIERKNTMNFDTKENVDLALEINITTGPNVQVRRNIYVYKIDKFVFSINFTLNLALIEEFIRNVSNCGF